MIRLKAFGVVKMGGNQLPWDSDIDLSMSKSEWGDMAPVIGRMKSKWGLGGSKFVTSCSGPPHIRKRWPKVEGAEMYFAGII